MSISHNGFTELSGKEYNFNIQINSDGLPELTLQIPSVEASFTDFPSLIPKFCGKSNDGYEFTLLQCYLINVHASIDHNSSTATYKCQILLENLYAEESLSIESITFELRNFLPFGNLSGYQLEYSELMVQTDNPAHVLFSNFRLGKANPKNCSLELFEDENFHVFYYVDADDVPFYSSLMDERITLSQRSCLRIIKKSPSISDDDLRLFIIKILNLFEVFAFERTQIKKVSAYSPLATYKDEKARRPINIISASFGSYQTNLASPLFEPYNITLPDLAANESIAKYLTIYDRLSPIMELCLESIHSAPTDPTRLFLNLCEALEVFHRRFITNSLNSFITKIDSRMEIIGATDIFT